ncbi:MAG: response regulator [Deltaproteobacteria bacterium]|nr:response regulator [Deltaproteobacteria bacterium]
MRILYVEDDELNYRLVEQLLVAADGHEVVHTKNGTAGLEEPRARRPDVVLMDLLLPKTDGFGTARRVREMPSFAGTPIAAVTGPIGEANTRCAMREGFDG